jgi:hypothetical protein
MFTYFDLIHILNPNSAKEVIAPVVVISLKIILYDSASKWRDKWNDKTSGVLVND